MQSFHFIPILCHNSAIESLKDSPKVSPGKKVPVQSIGFTGKYTFMEPSTFFRSDYPRQGTHPQWIFNTLKIVTSIIFLIKRSNLPWGRVFLSTKFRKNPSLWMNSSYYFSFPNEMLNGIILPLN